MKASEPAMEEGQGALREFRLPWWMHKLGEYRRSFGSFSIALSI